MAVRTGRTHRTRHPPSRVWGPNPGRYRARGHEIFRKRIVPPGEARPLFTDLFDATTGTLVEAKGTVERNAIRMAIGQLADYKRFVEDGQPRHLAVLVPSQPRRDLRELLASQGDWADLPGRRWLRRLHWRCAAFVDLPGRPPLSAISVAAAYRGARLCSARCSGCRRRGPCRWWWRPSDEGVGRRKAGAIPHVGPCQ
jgi:hypothetical protein